MEFPLLSIHYLYNYYMVYALLSHTPSCVVSPKEKKRKEKEK